MRHATTDTTETSPSTLAYARALAWQALVAQASKPYGLTVWALTQAILDGERGVTDDVARKATQAMLADGLDSGDVVQTDDSRYRWVGPLD